MFAHLRQIHSLSFKKRTLDAILSNKKSPAKFSAGLHLLFYKKG